MAFLKKREIIYGLVRGLRLALIVALFLLLVSAVFVTAVPVYLGSSINWLHASLLTMGCVALIVTDWKVRKLELRLESQRGVEPKGVCLACGYELRATPDRCPECGTIPIKAFGQSIS